MNADVFAPNSPPIYCIASVRFVALKITKLIITKNSTYMCVKHFAFLSNFDKNSFSNIKNIRKEAIDKSYEVLENNLIDIDKIKGGYGSFAVPRKQEIMAAYNRFRRLKINR